MFFAESIISATPFTAVRCEDYDELYYQGSCKGTGEKLIMGGFDIHYGYVLKLIFSVIFTHPSVT